jgi:hypothetical protein
MVMEIALLIGSLGMLGIAANRWGVDSRDSDVSLFRAAAPAARETILCPCDLVEAPAAVVKHQPRAHLRLRLHRAA